MRKKAAFRTAEWIFVFYILGQLLSECKQIFQEGLKAYVSDAFNLFDVGLLFNFLVVILLRIVVNNTGAGDFASPTTLQAIEMMMAVGGLFLWVRLLEAFAINRKLGPLLEMISKMVKDLVTFFGLMFVITMGFATAFHHLFHDIPQYSSWTRTSITLLSNLIGEGFTWDLIAAVQYRSPTLATLGQMLLVFFILLGTVLLLNLLIAILTEIFRRVSEEMTAEHNFDKARLVQRVMTRSNFACPPTNLLQPLFSGRAQNSNHSLVDIPSRRFFHSHFPHCSSGFCKRAACKSNRACISTWNRVRRKRGTQRQFLGHPMASRPHSTSATRLRVSVVPGAVRQRSHRGLEPHRCCAHSCPARTIAPNDA